MKHISWLFLILVVFYLGILFLSPVSRFKTLGQEEILMDLRRLEITINTHDRDFTMPQGGTRALDRMRAERFWLQVEDIRREYQVQRWIPWMALIGLAGLIVPWFRQKLHVRRRRGRRSVDTSQVEIPEAPSKEEYVDEFDFDRRIEAGFQRREEAVAWVLQDPMRNCDYCGGQLRGTFSGDRDALQLVTFYKRVPEGAKDLRVILGSYWFAQVASELKCLQCGRIVKR